MGQCAHSFFGSVLMRKAFFLFCLYLSQAIYSQPIQDHQIDLEALAELASYLHIPTGENLIEETQRRWLRRAGQERWDMAELSSEQRQFVLDWAEREGFFAPWKPLERSYDKALILGATTGHMRMRLEFLKQLWEEGVRFKEVVWLTGERPLDPRVDQLLERCANESEAARVLWEELEPASDMRKLPVLFVSVPMKEEGNMLKRPNTMDTIVAWLEQDPEPCKALFISTQPFCGYQFAVIKSGLPQEFLFDVAGPGANPSTHPAAAAITLDCVARWIYQGNLP